LLGLVLPPELESLARGNYAALQSSAPFFKEDISESCRNYCSLGNPSPHLCIDRAFPSKNTIVRLIPNAFFNVSMTAKV
jgi:hypothetical protein